MGKCTNCKRHPWRCRCKPTLLDDIAEETNGGVAVDYNSVVGYSLTYQEEDTDDDILPRVNLAVWRNHIADILQDSPDIPIPKDGVRRRITAKK